MSLVYLRKAGCDAKDIAALMEETVLMLIRVELDDVALKHIRRLVGLTDLDIHGPGVTDAGMTNLVDLVSLVNLALQNTRVTGTGLRRLQALPSLRSLDLTGTRLRNEDVAVIASFPCLGGVVLSGTGVDEGCLEHLLKLKHLYHLDLSDTKFSRGAVRKLRQAFPKAEIIPPDAP